MKQNFTYIKNKKQLLDVLACTPATFEGGLDEHLKSKNIDTLDIPKKNKKGYRTIVKIHNNDYSQTLKKLSTRLNNFFSEDKSIFLSRDGNNFQGDCVHGYVSGKSILTNAKKHIGAKFLLKADIKNFFPSVTTKDVETLFRDLKIQEEIAKYLATFVTYKGSLPLGFPTSPLIINAIFHKYDQEMIKLADQKGCKYTRYSDDLTFSSKEEINITIKELDNILDKSKFFINDKKFIKKKNGQAFYVTGLSISTDTRPRIPREFKKKLRQELYYINRFDLKSHISRTGGVESQCIINKIDGKIRYLKHIEPELGRKFSNQWKGILKKEDRSVTYSSRALKSDKKITMFFDETEVKLKDGKNLLMLGAVYTSDCSAVKQSMEDLISNWNATPDNPGKLISNSPHWAEGTPSCRTFFIQDIGKMPIDIVAAYKIHNESDKEGYSDTYLTLFKKLIETRFLREDFDNISVSLILEENNKIKLERLKGVNQSCYNNLQNKNSRKPAEKPFLQVLEKKKETMLSLPDLCLGAIRQYMTILELETNKESCLSENHFNAIVEKIKRIYNLDECKEYTGSSGYSSMKKIIEKMKLKDL